MASEHVFRAAYCACCKDTSTHITAEGRTDIKTARSDAAAQGRWYAYSRKATAPNGLGPIASVGRLAKACGVPVTIILKAAIFDPRWAIP